MRDASRFSRRDGDEAFGELKRLAQRGVAIWFYQDGTPFTFGTFGDNVVGFVRAEMNAEYRRQIAQVDARGDGPQGEGGARHRRARVRLRQRAGSTATSSGAINEAQADGRAADLRALRGGHRLHADRETVERRAGARAAPAAGAAGRLESVDRRRGAAPAALSRRGGLEQDAEARRRGQDRRHGAPGSGVAALDRPDLRIVSDDAWHAAHARLGGIRTQLDDGDGRPAGRRVATSSRNICSAGFARCATCGGTLSVVSRSRREAAACSSMAVWRTPSAARPSATTRSCCPIERVDDAVLAELSRDVAAAGRRHARSSTACSRRCSRRRCTTNVGALRSDLRTLDRKIANLTTADRERRGARAAGREAAGAAGGTRGLARRRSAPPRPSGS